RLQVEVLLAVRRGLALVARVVAAVLLHRGNAVLRGRLRVVRLTPQDRLAVAGLEDEGVLPLVVLAEHVPSGHECLPVAWGAAARFGGGCSRIVLPRCTAEQKAATSSG